MNNAMKNYCLFCLSYLFLAACTHPTQSWHTPVDPNGDTPLSPAEQIDLLALGDSYTKGQGIAERWSFPYQLRDSLIQAGCNTGGLKLVAQTGWRTDQLKAAIVADPLLRDTVFSVVTLLIGVNNQFQHKPLNQYRVEFEQLLLDALSLAGGRRDRVFVLSIPDYAYTPFGQGSPIISADIDLFNAVNEAITLTYGIAYVGVTDLSRQGLSISNWVAPDGLHPSGLQYAAWVHRLLPAVLTALKAG
jgi:lysophospholipase L1-like esterase